ncbi:MULTISPECIES: SAM-dependent methyltransferase [Streptomyces]|uniref:Methyltransferase n=1 Tax=Streptomyces nigrescens TaxID=1920 RepID=A0A640TW39_STRNI|nr:MULTISPECIES: SAM-dependent methyltransferase [Streptomyces]MCX5446237.1 SAM-dependent methyltransferase [Streptomyces libani]WAU00417.1 nodulation S family protein [Streptomyces libani subsp. libani]WDT53780.1 nodulation S family protein [Streptomyces sp. G7(2002)]GFE26246.1 methyltransferase [Streptomyces libani subsp. libani]GGV97889.1 methyltransferase [Streptomyces libani subsp. libani]
MSTPPAYFEAMYAGAVDPWDLAGRWYEQRKYALTLASLPRRRYRAAFEPGCSVGVLTARLAERCDRLLATDRMPSAVVSAAERTHALPQVEVRTLTIPDEWPDGTFDLIVLSELLHYFDDTALHEILGRTLDSLEPGGTLVAVHWNHPAPEHRRTGRDLAPVLAARPGLRLLTETHDPDFTLQTFWRRYPDGGAPPSPAAQEGLV